MATQELIEQTLKQLESQRLNILSVKGADMM